MEVRIAVELGPAMREELSGESPVLDGFEELLLVVVVVVVVVDEEEEDDEEEDEEVPGKPWAEEEAVRSPASAATSNSEDPTKRAAGSANSTLSKLVGSSNLTRPAASLPTAGIPFFALEPSPPAAFPEASSASAGTNARRSTTSVENS